MAETNDNSQNFNQNNRDGGDNVAGDKFDGDKVAGDKVEGDRSQQGNNFNDSSQANFNARVTQNFGPVTQNFVGGEPTQKLDESEPPDNLDGFHRNIAGMVGRETELKALHGHLKDAQQPIAIAGMGGIGKSELALGYGIEYREDYGGGRLRLTAGRLVEELVEFGEAFLGRDIGGKEPEVRAAAFWKLWREKLPAQGQPVLVIVDGVEDFEAVRRCLPWKDGSLGRFRVLLTTRCRFSGVSGLEVFELGGLSGTAARGVLLQRLDEKDKRRALADDQNSEEIADRICEFLGGLPLALELTGRRLRQDRSLDLATCWDGLREVETRGRYLQPQDRRAEGFYDGADIGVWATFLLSWQELGVPERELALVVPLFAPESIPKALLRQVVATGVTLGKPAKVGFWERLWRWVLGWLERGRSQRETLPEGITLGNFEEALGRLVEWSVLRGEQGRELVGVHPLMGEFLRMQGERTTTWDRARWWEALAQTTVLRAGAIPRTVTAAILTQWQPLIPHLEWVRDQDKDLRKKGRSSDVLLSRWKAINQGLARLRVLPMFEVIFDQAEGIRNKAERTGDYRELEQAAKNYQQAINLAEKYFESREKEGFGFLARCRYGWVICLRKLGEYDKAVPLAKKAIDAAKDHSPTLFLGNCLNELGVLYYLQGRYSDAEPLYRQSLEISESQLGSNRPSTAQSLNNLAALYYSQGRYSEAEPLYRQSLEISESQLGADHPSTAQSLNNLAALYYSQGRYSEAEPLYRQSLQTRESQLGADHPDTALSLNNLAALYKSQGRYLEAEPLYRQSLEISKSQLGVDHPSTAQSLNNLAALYYSQERYSEAESLYLRGIKILQTALGNDHPSTQLVIKNFQHFIQTVIEKNRIAQLSDHPLTRQILQQLQNQNSN
ncbi:MAG: tetratricopeptide repeat protein [Cyanobacteria bacterium P01_D01_bin.73]